MSMRARRYVVAVSGGAAFAALALACGLGSLDGLAAGGTSSPEAGPDVVVGDGSPGPDLSGPEGGTTPSGDAGVASDAGFCTTQQPSPPLCLDFDETPNSGYEDGRLVTIPVAEICSRCQATSASGGVAGSGFVVDVPANAATGSPLSAYLDNPVMLPARGASLRFSMQILTVSAGQEVDFVGVSLSDSTGAELNGYVVQDKGGSGSLTIEDPSTSDEGTFGLPADGQWHTYRIDIDAGPKRAALFLDGATQPTATIGLPGDFTPTNATLIVGPTVYRPSQHVRVAYDDVVFTVR
jgi:hypothetical protein